jgi:hypothetical protein
MQMSRVIMSEVASWWEEQFSKRIGALAQIVSKIFEKVQYFTRTTQVVLICCLQPKIITNSLKSWKLAEQQIKQLRTKGTEWGKSFLPTPVDAIGLYIWLSDYWAVGLLGCRTIGLSDYWVVGLLGCRTIGLLKKFKDIRTRRNTITKTTPVVLRPGSLFLKNILKIGFHTPCRTIGLSDHWVVGPLGCRTIGLSDHWVVGLLGCRTIGLSDHWAVGPLGCRTIGLSDYWAVGLLAWTR